MSAGQRKGRRVRKGGLPFRARQAMAFAAMQSKTRVRMIRVPGCLIGLHMAALTIEWKGNIAPLRMASLTIQCGMISGQRKPRLLMKDVHLRLIIPSLRSMTIRADCSELSLMNVQVTIQTLRTGFRKS